MSNERKTIGAWKKQTSRGEVISFTIDGKRYSMWINSYKKEEKHPDFNIVEDQPRPQADAVITEEVADFLKISHKEDDNDLPF